MAILIYGANGYVGQLLADACSGGERDVVLGARSESVASVARGFGLSFRVGGVDDIDLDGVDVVLNAAGPFAITAARLASRCIDHNVHYVDLAGEFSEIEAVQALDDRAQTAGVTLMPGVGFGVVPTDCLAVYLKSLLNDGDTLDIAFATTGGVSGGTLRTLAGGFGDRGAIDSDTLRTRVVDFDVGSKRCVQNPWRGDLATAPVSTGIDDVTTWISVPRLVERVIIAAHRKGDHAQPPLLAKAIRSVARRAPAGPSAKQLAKGRADVWAQLSNPSGQAVAATLTTPDAYIHTVDAALESVTRLSVGGVNPGFQTPAQAFGADFVLELPGVTRTDR